MNRHQVFSDVKKLITLVLVFLYFCAFSFDEGKAGFSIEVKGEINAYNIFSVFLLPKEQVRIKSSSDITLKSSDVQFIMQDNNSWAVEAPHSPGSYAITISNLNKNTMHLNVLVLTPISEKNGEYLHEYRIGNYPIKPLNGNPIYNRPKGFFEVTSENLDLRLTPHFKLRQFLCKQQSDFPKYLIIRERLLLKLEYLLAKANENNIKIETFGFISGYRTPFYNKLIKNVAYSRHVYGGAADIFIDEDMNGYMDDLNSDGKVNEEDVKVFYNIVDKEFTKSGYDNYKGGLGFYKKNNIHHGFIHVDVRGWKARW